MGDCCRAEGKHLWGAHEIKVITEIQKEAESTYWPLFLFVVSNALKLKQGATQNNVMLKIPDEIRRAAGWHVGDRLAFSVEGETLIVRKAVSPKRRRRRQVNVYGARP